MFDHPSHVEVASDTELKCKVCGGTRRLDVFLSDAARQLYIDQFSHQHEHPSKTRGGKNKKPMTYHERNALKPKS
jgi:hypothetical protein